MLSNSPRYCLVALLALACGDPPPVPAQEDVPLPVAARDSSVRSAAAALAAGHPWLASQRVRPALADSARRTPEALLPAARAAAGGGGGGGGRGVLRGWPWLAAPRVRPALADAARRTREALLRAARAAAGWGGWEEVERLLRGAPWLDDHAGGHGRELLTRAALARGADTVALERARAAVGD